MISLLSPAFGCGGLVRLVVMIVFVWIPSILM